jgi:hypothetical protein
MDFSKYLRRKIYLIVLFKKALTVLYPLYVRSRGTDKIWISLTKFPFSQVISRGPILISEKDPTKPKFLGKGSLSRTKS